MILRAGRRRWPAVASKSNDCRNLALFPGNRRAGPPRHQDADV